MQRRQGRKRERGKYEEEDFAMQARPILLVVFPCCVFTNKNNHVPSVYNCYSCESESGKEQASNSQCESNAN